MVIIGLPIDDTQGFCGNIWIFSIDGTQVVGFCGINWISSIDGTRGVVFL